MNPDAENTDRIMERMLDEVLGQEQPPDLFESIMARTVAIHWWFRLRVPAVAAALVLAAVGVGLWRVSRPTVETGIHGIASGHVLRRGELVMSLTDGDWFETGEEGAELILDDGSELAFLPDSEVIIHGPSGDVRQTIELLSGEGAFRVKKGDRTFEVATRIGRVTVVGTEFTVGLRVQQKQKGEERMNVKLVPAMVVAVALGSVEVDVGNRTYLLSAGQNQAFAEEEGAPRIKKPRVSEKERGERKVRKRRVSGTVESRDGNTLTIVHKGDSGSKTHTFDLGNAPVLLETDEYETVTGGEDGKRKQRKFAKGNPYNIERGQRVTVTSMDTAISEVRVYLPKKKREGGEGDREQPAGKPRVSEKERGEKKVIKQRVSGDIESCNGDALRVVQRGDSGSKTHTFNLSNAPVLVETDRYETVTGGEGDKRKRQKFVEGNRTDLEPGRRVIVTTINGTISKVLVYRPKKKREGGEGER